MKIKSIDITVQKEKLSIIQMKLILLWRTQNVNLLDRIHCLLMQATSSYSSKACTTEYNTNSV